MTYGEFRVLPSGGIVAPTSAKACYEAFALIVGNIEDFMYVAESRYTPFPDVELRVARHFIRSIGWAKPAMDVQCSQEEAKAIFLEWLRRIALAKYLDGLEQWLNIVGNNLGPDGYLPFELICDLPLMFTDMSDEIKIEFLTKLDVYDGINTILNDHTYSSLVDHGISTITINSFVDYLAKYESVAKFKAA